MISVTYENFQYFLQVTKSYSFYGVETRSIYCLGKFVFVRPIRKSAKQHSTKDSPITVVTITGIYTIIVAKLDDDNHII